MVFLGFLFVAPNVYNVSAISIFLTLSLGAAKGIKRTISRKTLHEIFFLPFYGKFRCHLKECNLYIRAVYTYLHKLKLDMLHHIKYLRKGQSQNPYLESEYFVSVAHHGLSGESLRVHLSYQTPLYLYGKRQGLSKSGPPIVTPLP